MRGPPKTPIEVKRARGTYRSDRDPDVIPKHPAKRAARRRTIEARILDLGAQLQSESMNLLRIMMEPGAFKAMEARLDAGETTLGAIVEFDSPHFAMLCQVTEGPPDSGWDKSLLLARVQQRVTGGSDGGHDE